MKKIRKPITLIFFILGQIIEISNSPMVIKNYEPKENEVKYFRPTHNTVAGKFLGVYGIFGLFVVCGEPDEIFLNYGYDEEKSKILYSSYRRKIPNSFCGTILNRHRTLIECGETDLNTSKLYFFLPSITDRSECVDKYMNNVSISPLDIKQEQLNCWAENVTFNTQKLDFFMLKRR